MSIINKLKNTALSLAIKLDMPAIVEYLIKDKPELVTNEVLCAAVSSGNRECLRQVLDINPITNENVNLVVGALELTPEDKYSKTLNELAHAGIVRPGTDLSKLLEIHCNKTANLDIGDKVDLFVNIGHMGGDLGEYTPPSEEFSKAVKDNINLIDYDIAKCLMSRGYLKDEGPIYKEQLIAGTSNAKMSLCGIAANADNVHFINAWSASNFSVNVNDAIATQDFATRVNNKLLCAEKIIEQKKISPETSLNEIRKDIEKDFYASGKITSFAVADGKRFDMEKGSPHGYSVPLQKIRTPGICGSNPENEFTNVYYNYNHQELKGIAEISAKLVNKQEREFTPEMKKEIESVLVTREKLYKEMFSPETILNISINKEKPELDKSFEANSKKLKNI